MKLWGVKRALARRTRSHKIFLKCFQTFSVTRRRDVLSHQMIFLPMPRDVWHSIKTAIERSWQKDCLHRLENRLEWVQTVRTKRKEIPGRKSGNFFSIKLLCVIIFRFSSSSSYFPLTLLFSSGWWGGKIMIILFRTKHLHFFPFHRVKTLQVKDEKNCGWCLDFLSILGNDDIFYTFVEKKITTEWVEGVIMWILFCFSSYTR